MPNIETLVERLENAACEYGDDGVSAATKRAQQAELVAARAAILAAFRELAEREKALRDALTKRQGPYLFTVRDLIARHAAGEGEYLHHWAKSVLPAIDAALASGEQS